MSNGQTNTPAVEPLFQPFDLNDLTLSNRIAMSPMTRQFSPHGVPGADVAAYYARRARGGAGLIVTEGSAVPHDVAHYTNRIPHVYGEAAMAGWREVVRQVHDAGAKIFVQLWHTGLGRYTKETDNPDVPSVGPTTWFPDHPTPSRAMDERDIADVIAAFGAAAANAKAAGFDGVNVHGAHGYLLDAFLWDKTNTRDDAWGGTVAARTRFAVEVVREVKRRAGKDFPVMLRISQWKALDYTARIAETPQELEVIVTALADAGVDIFDCSTRRFWLPEFEGSDLNLAGWTKKLSGRPTMTVGSVGLEGPLEGRRVDFHKAMPVAVENLARLMEMFGRGDFDLVAVGRGILANPDWANLVRAGRFSELRGYDPEASRTRLEPAA